MFTFYFERRPRLHLAEKVKFSMKSFREITFAHFAFDVMFLYEEKGETSNPRSDTGRSGKIVFFTIHCNPSLAYIAVRDLQSTQSNASSVQSLLLTGNVLYNQ